MATYYLRSTDGSDADDGSTWALAKAKYTALASAMSAAGDVGYISHSHDEDNTANISLTVTGTVASPHRLICGNDGAAPPTAVAATARFKTTGNFSINIHGSVYVEGLIIETGISGGSSAAGMSFCTTGANHVQEWVNCKWRLTGTHTAVRMAIGPISTIGSVMTLRNHTVKFAAVAQGISPGNLRFNWIGGGLEAGTTSPTHLFKSDGAIAAKTIVALLQNLDLSAGGTAMDVFEQIPTGSHIVMRNILFPTSWVGDLNGSTYTAGARIECYHYKIGSTTFALKIGDHTGTIDEELTIVRSTETLSYKMVSNTLTLYPQQVLRSGELFVPITGVDVGVAKTVTVEVIHNTTALNNDQVWLEVVYPTTSPTGTYIDDKPATILTAAAAQTTSSVTWDASPSGTPVKQALAVTFTPDTVGTAVLRVALAKASTTLYVSPKATKT